MPKVKVESALWKVVGGYEVPRSVPTLFLHVLWLKCVVSSAEDLTAEFWRLANSIGIVWGLWDLTGQQLQKR